MKLPSVLFSIILLCLLGCTTSHKGITPMSRGTVRDIDIRLATFGTGVHVSDVTDRVIHLLRTDAAGFSPSADTLGIDPVPFSSKCLVIDYYYKSKPCRFAVVGQQHVSYELLVKRAEQ